MSTKVAEIQPVVLSIVQAGAALSVSSDTMRRLIRNGAIPHARIGNSIRIRRTDLDDYLQGQISQQWRRSTIAAADSRHIKAPRQNDLAIFCGAGVPPAPQNAGGTPTPQ